MKKPEGREPSRRTSLFQTWRQRRATTLPAGAGQQSTTAPAPPGEPTHVDLDTSIRENQKDDCGRPFQRVHRTAPEGGPIRPA